MNKYPAYKESGSEIIQQIPAHWDIASLKFIGNITLGKMLTPEDKGGYTEKPYLRAKNIGWESVINVDDINTMWFSQNELQQFRLNQDDLLISEGGEVGRTAIWNKELDECYIQNSVHKVTVFENHHPRYYLYHSQVFGKTGYYDSIVNRVSIAHLTGEKLKDIRFVVPSFSEQQAIADFLDRKTAQIDTLIAKKKRQIELLQEQRTALINQAVTKGLNPDAPMKDSGIEWLGEIPSHWEVSKIKYLSYLSDGNHGEEYPEETDFTDELNGVPFIRVTEFEGIRITRKGILYITKEKNDSMRKGGLRENDILFVNRGSIGKIALVSKEFEGANLNSQIAYFRITSPKINYKYFLYYLLSSTFQNMINSLVHGGALQQLPLKRISGLEVLCPQFDNQLEIVEYLENMLASAERIIKTITDEIDLLREYRMALISEAVTGKIDVR